MDFALSDEQALIQQEAARVLDEASASEAVRRAMDTDTGVDGPLWSTLARDLGWCAISIPEAHGGLGLGPVEMVLSFEQAGRRLLCAPFYASAGLATPLLLAASGEARAGLLPRVAAGELTLSACFDGSAASAARVGDGWQVSGDLGGAPHAHVADQILLVAQAGDGTGLFGIEAGAQGLTVDDTPGWDLTRRVCRLRADSVPVTRLDEGGFEAPLPMALARLYLAAEQLGVAQQCLDLTVAYIQERKQFGRLIASFQAVKHRCAEMMVRIEALRSAVYGAAALAAGQPDAAELECECAMAASLALDVAFDAAGEAIQLHGGVGFTWEYDPQLYFKRAQAARHWLGTPDAMRARIAAAIIDA